MTRNKEPRKHSKKDAAITAILKGAGEASTEVSTCSRQVGDTTMAAQQIRLADCFVVAYRGAYISRSIPDTVYYAGPSDEERAVARAAAEAERERAQTVLPTLTFGATSGFIYYVQQLEEYLLDKASEDLSEGAYSERESR